MKDIQFQIGHKDPMTTSKIYTLATEAGTQQVVDLVKISELAGEIVELPEPDRKRSLSKEVLHEYEKRIRPDSNS